MFVCLVVVSFCFCLACCLFVFGCFCLVMFGLLVCLSCVISCLLFYLFISFCFCLACCLLVLGTFLSDFVWLVLAEGSGWGERRGERRGERMRRVAVCWLVACFVCVVSLFLAVLFFCFLFGCCFLLFLLGWLLSCFWLFLSGNVGLLVFSLCVISCMFRSFFLSCPAWLVACLFLDVSF